GGNALPRLIRGGTGQERRSPRERCQRFLTGEKHGGGRQPPEQPCKQNCQCRWSGFPPRPTGRGLQAASRTRHHRAKGGEPPVGNRGVRLSRNHPKRCLIFRGRVLGESRHGRECALVCRRHGRRQTRAGTPCPSCRQIAPGAVSSEPAPCAAAWSVMTSRLGPFG